MRDARFFYDSDRKRKLEGHLDKLGSVLFHKKLGSYAEKAERISELAGTIAPDILQAPDAADLARTAGRLAKADLATDMVREMTELQGTMGGIYAREDGTARGGVEGHLLPLPAHRRRGRCAADERATWRRGADVGGRLAGRQARYRSSACSPRASGPQGRAIRTDCVARRRG